MESAKILSHLQWSLWFILMILVMGYLSRSRGKRKDAKTDFMHFPISILVIGVVCSGFFVALAILSNIYPGVRNGVPLERQDPLVTAVFLVFAFVGAIIIFCYFIDRHRPTSEGLQYRSLTKRGLLLWRDITKVEYASTMKWFRLVDDSGHTVRVSVMMTGLVEFAEILLRQVPREKIDDFTHKVLTDTADGKLPPIWW